MNTGTENDKSVCALQDYFLVCSSIYIEATRPTPALMTYMFIIKYYLRKVMHKFVDYLVIETSSYEHGSYCIVV